MNIEELQCMPFSISPFSAVTSGIVSTVKLLCAITSWYCNYNISLTHEPTFVPNATQRIFKTVQHKLIQSASKGNVICTSGLFQNCCADGHVDLQLALLGAWRIFRNSLISTYCATHPRRIDFSSLILSFPIRSCVRICCTVCCICCLVHSTSTRLKCVISITYYGHCWFNGLKPIWCAAVYHKPYSPTTYLWLNWFHLMMELFYIPGHYFTPTSASHYV